jgi:release factor glutamine methyltransferase
VSLHEVLAAKRQGLTEAGIPAVDAALDVDLYTRTLVGWDRARLLTSLQDPVPEGLEPGLSAWTARRELGEPSAYIVGAKEFWGLELAVSPDVLIPRSESEFIVEETLALIGHRTAPRVADLGTGSGCLAVALVVARGNAARHGVDGRVAFVETSFLDGVEGPFDVVMANPPYVRAVDRGGLSRGVRHEPEVALFGGDNGLLAIAATLDAAIRVVAPGGWLVMEFGYGQEEAVENLVAERPALRLDRVRQDLQGIPRTAVIERR